jgi:hypothetical protein
MKAYPEISHHVRAYRFGCDGRLAGKPRGVVLTGGWWY